MKKLNCLFWALALIVAASSCSRDFVDSDESETTSIPGAPSSRANPTKYLDWENLDWMPTPPGQSRIPCPWIGPGSLTSTVGLEIIEDRRAADGWELLYNSFDSLSSGPLNNPYFVLYNKYRGLIRMFTYTTTEFVYPSSYLQDGISVFSPHESTMLNFLGREWIDMSQPSPQTYMQMQPAPWDGSAPLA